MTDCLHHPQIYSSREVDELLAEIQEAQSLRGHVQALHQSVPCEERTGSMHEVGGESPKLRPSAEARSWPCCALLSHLSRRERLPGLPRPENGTKRGPAPRCPNSCELPRPPLEGSWWIFYLKDLFQRKASRLLPPLPPTTAPPFPPVWRMMKTSTTQGRLS